MLIHITPFNNWVNIQTDGYLHPANMVPMVRTRSCDPDKISVFECQEPVDSALLLELRRCVAEGKNEVLVNKLDESDYVVLEVLDYGDQSFHWEDSPGQKRELLLLDMAEDLIKLIEYKKASESIPVSCLCVLDIEAI